MVICIHRVGNRTVTRRQQKENRASFWQAGKVGILRAPASAYEGEGSPKESMDTNKDYFLLATTDETGEIRGINYFTNYRDENVLWVFTSTEEAAKFVRRRVNRNQAYLDLLEDSAPDRTEGLAGIEPFNKAIRLSFRNLSRMAEDMEIDILALDAGSDDPTSRLFRVRKEDDYPDALPYMG